MARFVVFNVLTNTVYKNKAYETKRAAQVSATCGNRNAEEYVYCVLSLENLVKLLKEQTYA